MASLRRRFTGAIGCAALFALTAPSLSAQIVLPNDDPGIKGEGYVTYVGHYGEVFKLVGGWKIEASMHGEAEVINHYPDWRWISADLTEPFNPKPEDFVPENFTRDRLIQLIILPWTASSSKSLEALKPQKIADLKSSGVDFRIIDDPFPGYGHMGRRWPKGTFEVLVAKPYRLSQVYTTSGAHLAILTTGVDTPPSYVIAHHYDSMRMGLRDWVVPATGREVPQTSGPVPARDIPEEGISLRVFAKPQIWMTWVIITGAACLIFGILGVTKVWDPLRRASLSLLIFSNAGALIGGLVGLCFWPFAWSSPHLPIPSAVACLFIPLLAWLVGRMRGRRPHRRALIGTTVWALAAAAFLVYFSLVSKPGDEWAAAVPSFTAIFAFAFYAIGGVTFGFLDSASSEIGGRQTLATLTLLLISSRTLWAQPGGVLIGKATPNPIDSESVAIAQQKLAEHEIDRNTYWAKAEEKLGETEVLYAYQRVEIKGIWVKDNTDKTLPNLFNEQLEASHTGEKGNEIATPAWAQAVFTHAKDLYDLHADTNGKFTEAAKQAVERLRDKEVNEIVAHSWGSEIVYNAILHGDILPPRRLIVCGMPDRDKEKWLALSKYTGTEVVVYPNSRDPIAGAARLGGVLRDAAESSSEKVARKRLEDKLGLEGDPVGFEAQWEAECRQRSCNKHSRQPVDVEFKPAYKFPSHNRYLYHRQILKDKTIPPEDANAQELQDRQDAKIAAEADRLYALTVGREVANLRTEPEQVKSDSDFLGVWQQDANKIAAKTRAVQEAEKQARLTREKEQVRLEREYQELKQQSFKEEMDTEAANCGYRIDYGADNRSMLGFGSAGGFYYTLGQNQVPFDFGDLKVVFLMSRVCNEIRENPHKPAPPACNGAISLLRERVTRGDFVPKLRYLTTIPRDGGSYADHDRCIQDLLANADKINDTKSFDKVTSSYQKRLSKRLAEEAKRERKKKERDQREENPGGGSRSPDNDGRHWDEGCGCWVRWVKE